MLIGQTLMANQTAYTSWRLSPGEIATFVIDLTAAENDTQQCRIHLRWHDGAGPEGQETAKEEVCAHSSGELHSQAPWEERILLASRPLALILEHIIHILVPTGLTKRESCSIHPHTLRSS